jgi:VanZ family protein
MFRKLPAIVCVLVLCGILVAGLEPFHAPRNQVYWLQDRPGLRLGRYNTVLSAAPFGWPKGASCSAELWIAPGEKEGASIIADVYRPGNPFELMFQQYYAMFLLKNGDAKIGIDHVFEKSKPVFLTVTFGPADTSIFVNGAFRRAFSHFPITSEPCAGQWQLGGMAKKRAPLRGRLLGVALYQSALSARQVRDHYQSWITRHGVDLAGEEHPVAQYRFEERSGNIVHNEVRPGIDLTIPDRYVVLDQISMEDPVSEYHTTGDYWQDVAINIAGFIPLGWCFFGYFQEVRKSRHAAVKTVLVGLAASLTIEIFQSFLPTRSSGTTDLLTNTLGTYLGVLLWRTEIVQPLLAKFGIRWTAEPASEVFREV